MDNLNYENIKQGDTVEAWINNQKIIEGIVSSVGIVPATKFYSHFYNSSYSPEDEIYENAITFKGNGIEESRFYILTIDKPNYHLYDLEYVNSKSGIHKTFFSEDEIKFCHHNTILMETNIL